MFDAPDMFAANIGFWIGGLVGGALVWHFKDRFVAIGRKIVSWFKGAQYLIDRAKSDAVALQAKLDAIKAAVK